MLYMYNTCVPSPMLFAKYKLYVITDLQVRRQISPLASLKSEVGLRGHGIRGLFIPDTYILVSPPAFW